jgi:hypothetical protein
MVDLPTFERAYLAGATVTKPTIVLGVLTAAVSKVMSAYKNHGKTISAKRNTERSFGKFTELLQYG